MTDRSSHGVSESRATGARCASVLSFFHCVASGKVSDKGAVFPHRSYKTQGQVSVCAIIALLKGTQ